MLLKVLLHKFVQLKYFWIQFKNVHLQGPCSLRPCFSRPYCITIQIIFEPIVSAQLREIYYKDDDHGISNQVEPLHVATGHRMTLIKTEITKSFFPFCQNCSCLTFCIEDLEELWGFKSRFDFKTKTAGSK